MNSICKGFLVGFGGYLFSLILKFLELLPGFLSFTLPYITIHGLFAVGASTLFVLLSRFYFYNNGITEGWNQASLMAESKEEKRKRDCPIIKAYGLDWDDKESRIERFKKEIKKSSRNT